MNIDTSKWRGYYVWTPASGIGRRAEVSFPAAKNGGFDWSARLIDPKTWPRNMRHVTVGWSTVEDARAALGELFYPGDVVVTADEMRALISMELARQALDD